MKRAIYPALAFLLLTTLTDAIAIAQNTQEASSDPCVTRGGCVVTSYDRFQNSTLVLMTPALLTSPQNDLAKSLTLSVSYNSPGIEIARPENAAFFFKSSVWVETQKRRQAFDTSKSVYLLIDETSYPLGDVSLVKFENTEFPTWTYGLNVPFRILELIASGKTIEMRAGDVEVTFDNYLKAAFQRLVELAPKKADVVPPMVKSPALKRLSRRQRRRP